MSMIAKISRAIIACGKAAFERYSVYVSEEEASAVWRHAGYWGLASAKFDAERIAAETEEFRPPEN